jgi:hypothetical protein
MPPTQNKIRSPNSRYARNDPRRHLDPRMRELLGQLDMIPYALPETPHTEPSAVDTNIFNLQGEGSKRPAEAT